MEKDSANVEGIIADRAGGVDGVNSQSMKRRLLFAADRQPQVPNR